MTIIMHVIREKYVTWEAFEAYHKNLMNYIKYGDGISLEDAISENKEEAENED